MRKGNKVMRKRYWRDAIWFTAGTFLGGTLFGFIGRLLGRG